LNQRFSGRGILGAILTTEASVRAILGDNGEAIRGPLLNAGQLDVPALSPEEKARKLRIDSENPEFAVVINRVVRYELRYVVEG